MTATRASRSGREGYFDQGAGALGHRRSRRSTCLEPASDAERRWPYTWLHARSTTSRLALGARGSAAIARAANRRAAAGCEQFSSIAAHLKGIFAFAIWDARSQTLFARATTGRQALSYYWDGTLSHRPAEGPRQHRDVLTRARLDALRSTSNPIIPAPRTIFARPQARGRPRAVLRCAELRESPTEPDYSRKAGGASRGDRAVEAELRARSSCCRGRAARRVRSGVTTPASSPR